MKETMASEDFKAFLEQAEKLVNEAQEEVKNLNKSNMMYVYICLSVCKISLNVEPK